MILKTINLFTSNLIKNTLTFFSFILPFSVFAKDIPPHMLKKYLIYVEYDINYESNNNDNLIASPTVNTEHEIIDDYVTSNNSDTGYYTNSTEEDFTFENEDLSINSSITEYEDYALSEEELLISLSSEEDEGRFSYSNYSDKSESSGDISSVSSADESKSNPFDASSESENESSPNSAINFNQLHATSV
jgi:hypothetical protein